MVDGRWSVVTAAQGAGGEFAGGEGGAGVEVELGGEGGLDLADEGLAFGWVPARGCGAQVGEEFVFAAGEELGPGGEAGQDGADLLDDRGVARALVADEAGGGAAAVGMAPRHAGAGAHRLGLRRGVDDGPALEAAGGDDD